MDKSNNSLYSHIFHFNHNDGKWAAIPRDKQKDYFNNMNERVNTGILYSKDINALIDILNKKK